MTDSDYEISMTLERRKDYISEGTENKSEEDIYMQKHKKRIYTIKEKIIIAKEAITTIIHSTAKKYDIDSAYIRKWIKNIEKLKNTENKRERKTYQMKEESLILLRKKKNYQNLLKNIEKLKLHYLHMN